MKSNMSKTQIQEARKQLDLFESYDYDTMHTPENFKLLQELMKSENHQIRGEAVEFLETFSGIETAQKLAISFTQDEDGFVRKSAYGALTSFAKNSSDSE